MVDFGILKLHTQFKCHRGTCLKTGEREAMDSDGKKFHINPREQVEV